MSLRATKFKLDSNEYVVVSYPTSGGLADAPLSRAEQNVIELLLRGLSYRQIAEQRGRSVRTVAKQVASAFKKLGVSSRAELAAFLARSSSSRP